MLYVSCVFDSTSHVTGAPGDDHIADDSPDVLSSAAAAKGPTASDDYHDLDGEEGDDGMDGDEEHAEAEVRCEGCDEVGHTIDECPHRNSSDEEQEEEEDDDDDEDEEEEDDDEDDE